MSNLGSLCLYITIYGASAVLVCFSQGLKARWGRCLLQLAALMLPVLLAGFRYGVGTDYYNYEYDYSNYSGMGFSELLAANGILNGWGEWLLSRISFYLGGKQAFFALFAFCTYLPVVSALKHYRNTNWFLVVFAYLLGPFTSGLNIMKQALAVSIVFYGLRFVYDRKPFRYLLMIVLAMSVHTSAVIALPLYVLYEKGWTRKIWRPRVLSAVFAGLFMAVCIPELLSRLKGISLFGISKFAVYAQAVDGNNFSFLLSLVVFCAVLPFQRGLVAMEPKNRLLVIMVCLGVILSFTGYFSAYVKRISNYFYSIPSIVLLSQLPSCFHYKDRWLFQLGVLLYVIGLFIIVYVLLGQSDIIPYRIK